MAGKWIRTLAVLLAALAVASLASAGTSDRGASTMYKVLAPISSGNLTIYPVVAARTFNTSQFLTLDEGLRNGSVVVAEREHVQPLIRGNVSNIDRGGSSAEVNRLVLLNNSNRPLLLLAGEIVTGGKQDRVVGADRIVPAHSGPVDLGVFCVEPGRWTGAAKFGGTGTAPMAQPSVRKPAMADRDQQEVWANVRNSQENAGRSVSAEAQAGVVHGTTSYAKVMQNEEVTRKVDDISRPIQQNYENIIRDLHDRHAVGVVVAVNGRIIWADIFASTELLQAYWPKLIRSYAAEALTGSYSSISELGAQAFIDALSGGREVIETDPGVYRRSEVTGENFKVFSLTSLIGKSEFEVHLAKMADTQKIVFRPVRFQRRGASSRPRG